ncbi:hypothetical protein [Akkermansia muciniphila]|uniref:hypothetical protein n=2 Tax=Akkermansia muciniphila TaxID=239935 RepID=UPI001BFF6F71|nr:hypothetical protein [Akkermansia muciniphila]MBT8778294.1 hypothetical protein [Akkermansia muciniphila]
MERTFSRPALRTPERCTQKRAGIPHLQETPVNDCLQEKMDYYGKDMNRIAFSIIFGFSMVTAALTIDTTIWATKTIALLSIALTIIAFIFLVIAFLKKD